MKNLLAFLFVLLAAQTFAEEYIQTFESQITLNDDGSMRVHEIITVNVEGDKIRHGIYRKIPMGFKLPNGAGQNKTPIDVLSVKLNNSIEDFFIEGGLYFNTIYIGNSNRMAPNGLQRYEIIYSTKGHVFNLNQTSHLNYNASGLEWDFRIDTVKINVNYPRGWPLLNAEIYCGFSGSTQCDAIKETSKNGFFAQSKAPLFPKQGFTVNLMWPKGVMLVEAPEQESSFEFDVFLLFMLLLVSAVSYFTWYKVGNDRTDKNAPIQDLAPAGVPPYLAAVLRFMGITTDSFKASLFTIGGKGGLKMHIENDETVVFENTDKNSDAIGLSPLDASLRHDLFGYHDEIYMSRRYSGIINRAYSNYEKELKNITKNSGLFTKNVEWWLISLVMAIGLFGYYLNSVFIGSIDQAAGLIITSVFSFFPSLLVFNFFMNPQNWKYKTTMIVFTIITAILTVVVLSLVVSKLGLSILAMLSVFLTFSQLGFWLKIVPAPTKKGRQIINHLYGYKKFLELGNLNNTEKSSSEKERAMHFAYAIALGVEKEFFKHDSELKDFSLTEASLFGYIAFGSFWHEMADFDFMDSISVGIIDRGVAASSVDPNTGGGSSTGGFGGGFGGGGFSSGGGSGGGGGGGW